MSDDNTSKKYTYRCIGKGSYGKVMTVSSEDAILYCSKTMRKWYNQKPTLYMEPESVNIREVVLASSLGYPFITQTVTTAEKLLWKRNSIVMNIPFKGIALNEWVDVTPHEERWRLFWPLWSQLVLYCKTLLDGGIMHTDLRPSNIVLLKQNNEWVATLIDLGLVSLKGCCSKDDIASFPNPQSTNDYWNRWSQSYGTWIYCPPEVIIYHMVYDSSVSWNLAMTGMYMLLGTNPFQDLLPPGSPISLRQPSLDHVRKHQETWANGFTSFSEKHQKQLESIPNIDTWMEIFYKMTRWDFQKRASVNTIYQDVLRYVPLVSRQLCVESQRLPSAISYVNPQWPESLASLRPALIDWVSQQCVSRNMYAAFPLIVWLLDSCMEKRIYTLIPEQSLHELTCIAAACSALIQMIIDVHCDTPLETWVHTTQWPSSLANMSYQKLYALINKWLWTVLEVTQGVCWSPLPMMFTNSSTSVHHDIYMEEASTFLKTATVPYSMNMICFAICKRMFSIMK